MRGRRAAKCRERTVLSCGLGTAVCTCSIAPSPMIFSGEALTADRSRGGRETKKDGGKDNERQCRDSAGAVKGRGKAAKRAVEGQTKAVRRAVEGRER